MLQGLGWGIMAEADAALRIVPISQIAARGKWRAEALHAADHHLILWFTKGQGRLMISGRRRAFASNSVVYLPAGTPHAFEVKPGTFGSVVEIAPHDTLDLPTRPILQRTRDLLLHSEFVSLFEAMQREATRSPVSDRACRLHAGIVALWLERQPNELSDDRVQSASEKLATRYASLMEARFASGANVQMIAEELGVTPTHLTRVCKASLGVSAHDLLVQRTMYAARDLLSGTDRPVNRIAESLGFSSPAYFTRAFQKTTGQTPSAFRNGTRIRGDRPVSPVKAV